MKNVSSTPIKPVALVTGGRRGIGRAIAYSLASAGFDVAIADLQKDEDATETLQGLTERGARAEFITCDIADVDGHAAVLSEVNAILGTVSCLVNNAGISVVTSRSNSAPASHPIPG